MSKYRSETDQIKAPNPKEWMTDKPLVILEKIRENNNAQKNMSK